MFKKMVSSPHTHSGKINRPYYVMGDCSHAACSAHTDLLFWNGCFGAICFGYFFALVLEFIVTKLRYKPNLVYISDFSVVLTALILTMAIPPYAPYWVILIGTLSAVILGKHVYGGLGQNPFNPAMVGYVVLLISFPLQMTSWMPPISLLNEPPTFEDSLSLIFTHLTTDGFSLSQLVHSIDGITQATPLDSAKIFYNLHQGDESVFHDFVKLPILLQNGTDFAEGWWQVNLAFMLGGIVLILKKKIHWQIPVSMLVTFVTFSDYHCDVRPSSFKYD